MLATSGVLRAELVEAARQRDSPVAPTATMCTTAFGRGPECQYGRDRVVDRRRADDIARLEILQTMSTISPAGVGRHARVARVGRGIECCAGKREPKCLRPEVMVDAVPMVMQWPGEPRDTVFDSAIGSSLTLPARFSAQYFQTSEPLPSGLVAPVAAQHRPRRHEDSGEIHMLIAPISNAGVVLSQPPHQYAPRPDTSATTPRSQREQIAVEASSSASGRLRRARSPASRAETAGLQHFRVSLPRPACRNANDRR